MGGSTILGDFRGCCDFLIKSGYSGDYGPVGISTCKSGWTVFATLTLFIYSYFCLSMFNIRVSIFYFEKKIFCLCKAGKRI